MSSNRSLEQNKRIFKIIVIGDSSVGKTCLTYRFCGGKFPMKTEATIGVDFRERAVQVDNETIKLTFWDTAGTERFRQGMPPNFYRRVHVVIFVYDITNLESYTSLNYWMHEWMAHRTGDMETKMILIGNKNDAESKRCVSTSNARIFAKCSDMLFFETSAAKAEMPDLDKIVENIASHAKKADLIGREPTITLKSKITTETQCLCC